jgi:hypothetical protein
MKGDIKPEYCVVIYYFSDKKSDLNKALVSYLQEKVKVDVNDAVSIIHAISPPMKLKDFQDSIKDCINKISGLKPNKNLESPPVYQKNLESSFKMGVNLLSDYIKQLGSQVYRILLLIDYPTCSITPDLQSLLKTAAGLSISVDVCLFVSKKSNPSLSEYKSIADLTHGEFGSFEKTKALFQAIKGFASKKITDTAPIRLLSPEEKRDDKALAELATPLQFLTEEFISDYAVNKSKIKCQVCFGLKCPLDGHDFLVCGRLCPNCGRTFHLHCAGMWAQKSEVAPNLFRCPSCYTLLKLPTSIQTGMKIKDTRKAKNLPATEIKMIRAKPENLTDTIEVCSYCYGRFNNETPNPENSSDSASTTELKVFRCSVCNAHYHSSCLEKMYKENKTCKNCGGMIK